MSPARAPAVQSFDHECADAHTDDQRSLACPHSTPPAPLTPNPDSPPRPRGAEPTPSPRPHPSDTAFERWGRQFPVGSARQRNVEGEQESPQRLRRRDEPRRSRQLWSGSRFLSCWDTRCERPPSHQLISVNWYLLPEPSRMAALSTCTLSSPMAGDGWKHWSPCRWRRI